MYSKKGRKGAEAFFATFFMVFMAAERRNEMFTAKNEHQRAPLYQEQFEHDNCGIGACVNIKGQKSRETVENALKIVENLEHRAGRDALSAAP